MPRRLIALLAVLFVVAGVASGCGGGHTKTVTQTVATTPAIAPTGGAQCTLTRGVICDPEPTTVFGQSLGPVPGTVGSNGRLTAGSLAPIVNGRLAKPAAAAWNTMNLYSRRYLHANVLSGTGDASYRTFARQVYWKNVWCSRGACYNAATPGYSNHGWGRSDDLNDCGGSRSAFDRSASKFGFFHGEAPLECWHVTWGRSSWTTPNPGADYNNPRLCHGSSGPGQGGFVKDVQHSLSRHHLNTVASGFFTLGTVHNLKVFQAQRHLLVHTCTDRATWQALRR